MSEIVKFIPKNAYPKIIKEIDGEKIECIDIDALTDEQFKQYCRDTGSEWFPRLNETI